jgi:hypothetical protein
VDARRRQLHAKKVERRRHQHNEVKELHIASTYQAERRWTSLPKPPPEVTPRKRRRHPRRPHRHRNRLAPRRSLRGHVAHTRNSDRQQPITPVLRP